MVYFESTPPEIFHFLNFKDAKFTKHSYDKIVVGRAIEVQIKQIS